MIDVPFISFSGISISLINTSQYTIRLTHFTACGKISFFHNVKQNTRNVNSPLFTIVILVTLGFDESHAISVLQ